MNQQRSRRFRSAVELKKLRGELKPGDQAPFDSNCITPGTEFMAKFATNLRFFIAKKINQDKSWKNVQVIFSGVDVIF